MIIAIDGPAGVGKSSIAQEIAKRTDFFYLNSGNFYRCVTLAVLNNGVDPLDNSGIVQIAEKSVLAIIDNKIHLNGTQVEDQLHTDEIDRYVAQHSSIPRVREIINGNLRQVAKNMNVVAEGRDMATVVFTEADLKVYLDASLETRASRRFKQGVSTLTKNEILKNIRERDELDKKKPFGRLKISQDALYLDTSDLTREQVCEKVMKKIDELR